MSKKTLIIIFAVLLLGIAGFLYSRRPSPDNLSNIEETQELAQAVTTGKPMRCLLTREGDTVEYIIKDKNFRMKTTTATTENYAVSDSTYLYSWSSASKQGIKMRIPTEEEAKEMQADVEKYQATAPQFSSEDGYQAYQSQGYTVDCQAFTPSDSDFTPPTDIEFVDPSSMFPSNVPQVDGTLDMDKLQEMAKDYQ